MNEKYYNIADIIIKIVSPFQFITENGKSFICGEQEVDYTFQFEPCDNIAEMLENTELIADLKWAHEYRQKDGTWIRAFLWNERFYPIVTVMGEKRGVCYYASADILADKAEEGFELWMYLCLEHILLKRDALVLHSSHINVNGNGIVFSAPSQTGKSTQAELWKQYAGAQIINGDRSIVRKKDGVWNVYGCPMCGSSGIHEQGCEPLCHIVMLTQGKQNAVRQIKGMEAFKRLYPEITVSKWNISWVNKTLELLSLLLEDVPVWYYSCTKDRSSVEYLKGMFGMGERV